MFLSERLSELRSSGRKLLIPYITGGVKGWGETLQLLQTSGADALEIGIPFSDAVMDGPVICAANDRALAKGATPAKILAETKGLNLEAPVIAMTYYNIAFRPGLENFASTLKESNIAGAILADLPYEASQNWIQVATAASVSPVLLAAPTADDDRLRNIAEISKGFIYAVGLLGVTGVRKELAESAIDIARRLKKLTDTPVLVGVGISTPKQAKMACEVADGVIVGSALVKTLLETQSPTAVGEQLADFRTAID